MFIVTKRNNQVDGANGNIGVNAYDNGLRCCIGNKIGEKWQIFTIHYAQCLWHQQRDRRFGHRLRHIENIRVPLVNAANRKVNLMIVHGANLAVSGAVLNSAPIITGN